MVTIPGKEALEKEAVIQTRLSESSQNDVVLSVQGVSKKFCRDL